MRYTLHLSLLFALTLLAACGVPEQPLAGEAEDQTESEIIGGVVDNGDPAVMAIFARESPTSDRGSLCTGTLITPRVLLTAAHCVYPGFVGETAVFEVYAATDFTQTTQAEALAVEFTAYHAFFNPDDFFAGHDIAIVVLERAVNIRPMRYQRSRLGYELTGRIVRQIGYGVNDRWAQTGSGVKRQTNTVLHALVDGLLFFGDIDHSQCHGDSGGPTILRTRSGDTIIGVSSFGSPDGHCFGSFDTRVDSELDFIDEALALVR